MRCQSSTLETRCAIPERIGNEHGEEELGTGAEHGIYKTQSLTAIYRSWYLSTLHAAIASTASAAKHLAAPKVQHSYPQHHTTIQLTRPPGELFGNSVPANSIPGGQAEYVRCPLADSTFVLTPKNIPEEMLVLMADIFPTGYFAASRYLKNLNERDRKEFTVVCVGCGPVGICAITAALTMVDKVYVVDSVPERLEEARKIGAIPINLNDDPVAKIKAASDGRGADVVMEVVGHADAFHLAFDMIRPWGQISSIGVHTEPINMNGLMMYGKNVSMAFGRCPVRSIFEEALEVLVKEQKKLAFLCGKTMSLEDAPKAYEDFEQRKVTKVVFKMDKSEAGQDVAEKVKA
jgi:threonine dehydrogenase-like Zn-dependent dehydrogenase